MTADSLDLSKDSLHRVETSRMLFAGSWMTRQLCAHSRITVVMAIPSKAMCQNDRPSSKPPGMKLACAWNAGTGDPGTAKRPVGQSNSATKISLGKPRELMSSKSSLLLVRSFAVNKSTSSLRRSLVSLPMESNTGTTRLFKAGTVAAVAFNPSLSICVVSFWVVAD